MIAMSTECVHTVGLEMTTTEARAPKSGFSHTLSKVKNNYWITHRRSVIKCVLI